MQLLPQVPNKQTAWKTRQPQSGCQVAVNYDLKFNLPRAECMGRSARGMSILARGIISFRCLKKKLHFKSASGLLLFFFFMLLICV